MIERLEAIVSPALQALGFKLWGCELQQDNGRYLLRVYVDDTQPVTLDTCADISRQVAMLLDVEDPIKGRYDLEVSSPGMRRRLFTIEQCQRYVGETVKCRLRIATQGQRNFSGTLKAVENDQLMLETDEGHSLTLTFNDIEKIKLDPVF